MKKFLKFLAWLVLIVLAYIILKPIAILLFLIFLGIFVLRKTGVIKQGESVPNALKRLGKYLGEP